MWHCWDFLAPGELCLPCPPRRYAPGWNDWRRKRVQFTKFNDVLRSLTMFFRKSCRLRVVRQNWPRHNRQDPRPPFPCGKLREAVPNARFGGPVIDAWWSRKADCLLQFADVGAWVSVAFPFFFCFLRKCCRMWEFEEIRIIVVTSLFIVQLIFCRNFFS